MKKKFNVCGLGNALVDILVRVDEEKFVSLNLEKSTMRLVDSTEQAGILRALGASERHLASGGSVANSMIAHARLGGRTAYLCCLGDDEYGHFFSDEYQNYEFI